MACLINTLNRSECHSERSEESACKRRTGNKLRRSSRLTHHCSPDLTHPKKGTVTGLPSRLPRCAGPVKRVYPLPECPRPDCPVRRFPLKLPKTEPRFSQLFAQPVVQGCRKTNGNANHRSDDYFSVAYWYQTEPHAKFPALPPVETRLPKIYSVGGPGNAGKQ